MAGDGLAVDGEPTCEPGCVERASLQTGQHGREAAQRFRRDTRPVLRDVALQGVVTSRSAPAASV